MKLIRDSCIRIPNDIYRDEIWYQLLLEELTRKQRVYGAGEGAPYDIKRYYNVDQDSRQILIPRFYNIKGFPGTIVNNVPEGEDIHINSLVSARNDRQKESMEWFRNNRNGILCLDPGEGKTVVAIDSICKIGKKAIIFVHKDSLLEQWRDRFFTFTDIKEDQIVKLKTSQYEEHLKKPIILSTVQTFCSMLRHIPDLNNVMWNANIGVAIWDECHTSVSAEKFSESSMYLPCSRVYGLSATPTRADGNTDIMNHHLGDVFVPFSTGIQTMTPVVKLIKFSHGVMKTNSSAWVFHDTGWDKNQKNYKPFFDYARYLKKLISSESYINMVTKITKQAFKSSRKTLFLTDRIKILDFASKACSNPDEVGFFIPRTGKDRDAHLQRRFVFSTYGSARDGTDKQELDCLILATPVGNLTQAAGRVTRWLEGKQQPVIIDLVDIDDDILIDKAKKRIEFYLSKGWTIEEKLLK